MRHEVLIGLMAGGLLLPARADDVPVYTVDECVAIGLRNSGVARNARRDEAIGREIVRQAWAEAHPQVSASANYTRLDELQDIGFGDEVAQLGTLDNYQVQANVEQLLFSGGRVGAGVRAARLTRDMLASTAEVVEHALVRDIRQGFHAILFSREAVRVREASVAQLKAHAEETDRKYRSGAVSELDALNARVRLANERPRLIGARNTRDVALANFRRLLDLEDEPFEIRGGLHVRPVPVRLVEAQALALENHPEIRRLETLVPLRNAALTASRSGWYPSLRAFFSYTGANGYQFVSFEDTWEWHWNAGLTAEWDLWDGNLTRGVVREKRLDYEKALTDLAEASKSIRLAVRTAFLDLEHAQQSVEAGAGTVELAERALAIASNRYESGLGTQLEFTESQVLLSTARLELLAARRDYMDAVAQLQYACGLRERDLYMEAAGPGRGIEPE